MAPKSNLPWDLIEQDYRTGLVSNYALAKKYGCSDTAIRKHMQKKGITQDLRAQVQEQTQQAVSIDPVRVTHAPELGSDAKPTDEQVVQMAAAQAIALVRDHRGDINRAREATNSLMNELIAVSADPAKLEEAIENFAYLQTADWDDYKKRDAAIRAMVQALNLKSRSEIARNLAGALRFLLPLERQAFNLDKEDDGKPKDYVPVEERVKRLSQPTPAPVMEENVVPFPDRRADES